MHVFSAGVAAEHAAGWDQDGDVQGRCGGARRLLEWLVYYTRVPAMQLGARDCARVPCAASSRCVVASLLWCALLGMCLCAFCGP
jgi:hypothetical protein